MLVTRPNCIEDVLSDKLQERTTIDVAKAVESTLLVFHILTWQFSE